MEDVSKNLEKRVVTLSGSMTHYYQKPGRYMVCLRVSDPVSEQTDTYCAWVQTKNAVNAEELNITGVNLSVYPNPFTHYTLINYAVPQSQYVELAIYDQLGRRIETLVKTRKETGIYQIVWETKNLTTGVYHLKLITKNGIITKQLIIAK